MKRAVVLLLVVLALLLGIALGRRQATPALLAATAPATQPTTRPAKVAHFRVKVWFDLAIDPDPDLDPFLGGILPYRQGNAVTGDVWVNEGSSVAVCNLDPQRQIVVKFTGLNVRQKQVEIETVSIGTNFDFGGFSSGIRFGQRQFEPRPAGPFVVGKPVTLTTGGIGSANRERPINESYNLSTSLELIDTADAETFTLDPGPFAKTPLVPMDPAVRQQFHDALTAKGVPTTRPQ